MNKAQQIEVVALDDLASKDHMYVGIMKNQFAAFIQAMVFNIKRIVKIHAEFLDPPQCWTRIHDLMHQGGRM